MADAEAAQPEDYEDGPIRDATETVKHIAETIIFIFKVTGETTMAMTALIAEAKKYTEEILNNPWDRSQESQRGLADVLAKFTTSELLLQQSQILSRLFNFIIENRNEQVKTQDFLNHINRLQHLYVYYNGLIERSQDKTLIGRFISNFGYTAYRLYRHLKPGEGKSSPELINNVTEFLAIFQEINDTMASLLNEFPQQASNPQQMQDYNRLVQKLISAIEKIDDTDVINKVFNSVGLSNPEEEQIT